MLDSSNDRRVRRSSDPITALHYQLSSTRYEAGFDAVVLVDDAGALVAGAGAWPLCEELAAFAPLLAHRDHLRHREASDAVTALLPRVALVTLSIHGSDVVLAARGEPMSGAEHHLALAAAGCHRILEVAALSLMLFREGLTTEPLAISRNECAVTSNETALVSIAYVLFAP